MTGFDDVVTPQVVEAAGRLAAHRAMRDKVKWEGWDAIPEDEKMHLIAEVLVVLGYRWQ